MKHSSGTGPVHSAVVILLAFAATACAPWGREPGRISVSSQPVGAEVFVMGEKVGTTPMSVDLGAIFPSAYAPERRALYGTVELRKAGCASATNAVTAKAIEKGLDVKLSCGGTADNGAGTAIDSGTPGSGDIEARLRRVRELREKGLISEQEERDARQRILHDL